MPTPEQREYFARRAATAREQAKAARDPEFRTILERMAESYDKLVEETDRIAYMRTQLPKT